MRFKTKRFDNRGIRTLALSDQISRVFADEPDSGALDHSAILPC